MSRILITIPTWNEAVVIERNLRAVCDATKRLFPNDNVTIEVADNGSTDATREIVQHVVLSEATAKSKDLGGEILRQAQDDGGEVQDDGVGRPNLKLLEVDGKGKGLAIRRSWMSHLTDGDVLVFMDADLAADLEALPRLVAPIIEGRVDLVCGSRFLGESRIKRSASREAASRLYRRLQQLLLQLPVKDAQCGFKAISAGAAGELLPLCKEDGWLFDTELLAFASQKHKKTLELAISWIEQRDPARRSALRLFRHGWGFMIGLVRIRSRVTQIGKKVA